MYFIFLMNICALDLQQLNKVLLHPKDISISIFLGSSLSITMISCLDLLMEKVVDIRHIYNL